MRTQATAVIKSVLNFTAADIKEIMKIRSGEWQQHDMMSAKNATEAMNKVKQDLLFIINDPNRFFRHWAEVSPLFKGKYRDSVREVADVADRNLKLATVILKSVAKRVKSEEEFKVYVDYVYFLMIVMFMRIQGERWFPSLSYTLVSNALKKILGKKMFVEVYQELKDEEYKEEDEQKLAMDSDSVLASIGGNRKDLVKSAVLKAKSEEKLQNKATELFQKYVEVRNEAEKLRNKLLYLPKNSADKESVKTELKKAERKEIEASDKYSAVTQQLTKITGKKYPIAKTKATELEGYHEILDTAKQGDTFHGDLWTLEGVRKAIEDKKEDYVLYKKKNTERAPAILGQIRALKELEAKLLKAKKEKQDGEKLQIKAMKLLKELADASAMTQNIKDRLANPAFSVDKKYDKIALKQAEKNEKKISDRYDSAVAQLKKMIAEKRNSIEAKNLESSKSNQQNVIPQGNSNLLANKVNSEPKKAKLIRFSTLEKIDDKGFDVAKVDSGGEIRGDLKLSRKYVKAVFDELEKKGIEKGTLPDSVYSKLEDENFHLLNLVLSLGGYFKNESKLHSYDTILDNWYYVNVVKAVKEVSSGIVEVDTKSNVLPEKMKTEEDKIAESLCSNKKIAKMVEDINVDNVTSKDLYRDMLCGHYCEDGYKIATDGRRLVVIKEDYPAEQEGQIVPNEQAKKEKLEGDDGFIHRNFPSYKRAIPENGEGADVSALFKEIDLIIKRCQLLSSFTKWRYYTPIRIGGAYFDPFYLKEGLCYAKKYGWAKFEQKGTDKALKIYNSNKPEDKSCYVIMPCTPDKNTFVMYMDEDGHIIFQDKNDKLDTFAKTVLAKAKVKYEKLMTEQKIKEGDSTSEDVVRKKEHDSLVDSISEKIQIGFENKYKNRKKEPFDRFLTKELEDIVNKYSGKTVKSFMSKIKRAISKDVTAKNKEKWTENDIIEYVSNEISDFEKEKEYAHIRYIEDAVLDELKRRKEELSQTGIIKVDEVLKEKDQKVIQNFVDKNYAVVEETFRNYYARKMIGFVTSIEKADTEVIEDMVKDFKNVSLEDLKEKIIKEMKGILEERFKESRRYAQDVECGRKQATGYGMQSKYLEEYTNIRVAHEIGIPELERRKVEKK